MVVESRRGFEDHVVAGPMQAKRHVHVFEIRLERFGKPADPKERIPTKEPAGGAGPEDPARLEICRAERLTMPSLPGNAAYVIAIAGTVNREQRRRRVFA